MLVQVSNKKFRSLGFNPLTIEQGLLDEVATVPLGQFYLQTAYRASLRDMVKGTAPFPWGIRPA